HLRSGNPRAARRVAQLMKYVLDSSVAVKWVLPEVDSDKADLLRVDFQNGIHELVEAVLRGKLGRALARVATEITHFQRVALDLVDTQDGPVAFLEVNCDVDLFRLLAGGDLEVAGERAVDGHD